MKRNDKLSKRNQKKKEFKDKDIHLNVVGIPEKNVNVKKTSPDLQSSYDIFKIVIDTENRRKSQESGFGPATKRPKKNSVDQSSLFNSMSNNNTFSNQPTELSLANKKLPSNSSTGVCFSDPSEDNKYIKIVSPSPPEHQLMAKKLKRDQQTKKQTPNKQVVFGDEDAVYGTPSGPSSESDEELSYSNDYPYNRTSPQVYQVDDSTPGSTFKNHNKFQVIPPGTYLGGEDEASVVSKLSKKDSGVPGKKEIEKHESKNNYSEHLIKENVPTEGAVGISYPSTSKEVYPAALLSASKDKTTGSGLAGYKKSKLSSIDELDSVGENTEYFENNKQRTISPREVVYPPPVLAFEKLNTKPSKNIKTGIESDPATKRNRVSKSTAGSVLSAHPDILKNDSTDHKTEKDIKVKSNEPAEALGNKEKSQNSSKADSKIIQGRKPTLVDREIMTESVDDSFDSIIGPKIKNVRSSTKKQSKDSSKQKSPETAQRSSSSKSKISTIISSIPKPSFLKSPSSVRKPLKDSNMAAESPLPSRKLVHSSEPISLETGDITNTKNHPFIDEEVRAPKERLNRALLMTSQNDEQPNSFGKSQNDTSTMTSSTILSAKSNVSKKESPKRYMPKSVSDEISFEIANRSFGVSLSTEIPGEKLNLKNNAPISRLHVNSGETSGHTQLQSTSSSCSPHEQIIPVNEHVVATTNKNDNPMHNKYIDDLIERLNMDRLVDDTTNTTETPDLEEMKHTVRKDTLSNSTKMNTPTHSGKSDLSKNGQVQALQKKIRENEGGLRPKRSTSTVLENTNDEDAPVDPDHSTGRNNNMNDGFRLMAYPGKVNNKNPFGRDSKFDNDEASEKQRKEPGISETPSKTLLLNQNRHESSKIKISDSLEDKNEPQSFLSKPKHKKDKTRIKKLPRTKIGKDPDKPVPQKPISDEYVPVSQNYGTEKNQNIYDNFGVIAYPENVNSDNPFGYDSKFNSDETAVKQQEEPDISENPVLNYELNKISSTKVPNSLEDNNGPQYLLMRPKSQMGKPRAKKGNKTNIGKDPTKVKLQNHTPDQQVYLEQTPNTTYDVFYSKNDSKKLPPNNQTLKENESLKSKGPKGILIFVNKKTLINAQGPFDSFASQESENAPQNEKRKQVDDYTREKEKQGVTAVPLSDDKYDTHKKPGSSPGDGYKADPDKDKAGYSSPYGEDTFGPHGTGKFEQSSPYDKGKAEDPYGRGGYTSSPYGEDNYGMGKPGDERSLESKQPDPSSTYGQGQFGPKTRYDKTKPGRDGFDPSSTYGRGKLGPSSPSEKDRSGNNIGYGQDRHDPHSAYGEGKLLPLSPDAKGRQVGYDPSSAYGRGKLGPSSPYEKRKPGDKGGFGQDDYDPSSAYGRDRLRPSSPYEKGKPGDKGGYRQGGYDPSSAYGRGKLGPSSPHEKGKPGDKGGYRQDEYDPSSAYGRGKLGPSSPHEKGKPGDKGGYRQVEYDPSSAYGRGKLGPSSPHEKGKPGDKGGYRQDGYDPSLAYGRGKLGPSSPHEKGKPEDKRGYRQDGDDSSPAYGRGKLGPSSPYEKGKPGDKRGYRQDGYDPSSAYGRGKLGSSSPYEKRKPGDKGGYGQDEYDPSSSYGRGKLGPISPYEKGKPEDKGGHRRDGYDPSLAYDKESSPHEKGKRAKPGDQSVYAKNGYDPSSAYGKEKGGPASHSGKGKPGDVHHKMDIYGPACERCGYRPLSPNNDMYGNSSGKDFPPNRQENHGAPYYGNDRYPGQEKEYRKGEHEYSSYGKDERYDANRKFPGDKFNLDSNKGKQYKDGESDLSYGRGAQGPSNIKDKYDNESVKPGGANSKFSGDKGNLDSNKDKHYKDRESDISYGRGAQGPSNIKDKYDNESVNPGGANRKFSGDKGNLDSKKDKYYKEEESDLSYGRGVHGPSNNKDMYDNEPVKPRDGDLGGEGMFNDSSRERKEKYGGYGGTKVANESASYKDENYFKGQTKLKPIQAKNHTGGIPQTVSSEYLFDSASLEGGEGKRDKTVDIERSPSGARITQNHPCGCKTTTYSGPGSELKGEEIMSAFCKEGSKCEIANSDMRTGGRRISVYKTPESAGDSQYDRFPSRSERSLDKRRSIPEIEVIANGMISKKKIKPRPPAPTMKGVNYSGSLNIKSDKLNGVCNFYLDPRLKTYLRNNMHKLRGFLEDEDTRYRN